MIAAEKKRKTEKKKNTGYALLSFIDLTMKGGIIETMVDPVQLTKEAYFPWLAGTSSDG
jgi:hypothetical protein